MPKGDDPIKIIVSLCSKDERGLPILTSDIDINGIMKDCGFINALAPKTDQKTDPGCKEMEGQ